MQRLGSLAVRRLVLSPGGVRAARDPQFRRINLEIQGNTDAFLHAHVTPRYEWEPFEIVGWPAALHHWTKLMTDPSSRPIGPEHAELRQALGAEIDRQLARAALR